ncbi:MAG: L,D-transpeptidase family protein [Phycisphaerae bacterium]
MLIDAGKLIEARESLNHVVQRDPNSAEGADARALMTNLAEQTIYSPRVFPDDPLMTTRKVAPSELLVKIAGEFNVPHEVIQQINGIADATKVRAGQVLKMPRGPFHARIYKSQFRLDLYLQDTFVRSFRVGLGEDNGTPEGTWSVTERISNPTYYPPASAKDRRKIDGNDPSNPLGEHWIGLKGVDGAAVGQTGFGIHGTIEPDSIGRSASMGCVRMHNEDVAFVFNALAPRQSTVTILP